MRLFNIIINILAAILLALFLTFAPPEIPLYYSRPWGEDQIATKWDLLIIPILINISICITYWFRKRSFPDNEVFGRIAGTIHIVLTIALMWILIRTMVVIL